MNERLPYEEQLTQQLENLPLPDENMAWEDMKRRLEEDDDGIIPIWIRGCGPWALLAIVLLGLSWWFIRPNRWMNKKQEGGSEQTFTRKDSGTDSVKINGTEQPDDNDKKEKQIPVTKSIKDSIIEKISQDRDVNSDVRLVKKKNDKQARTRSVIHTGRIVGQNQPKKKNQSVARKEQAKTQTVKVKKGISTRPPVAGKKDETDVGDLKNKSPVQSNDIGRTPTNPTVSISKQDTAVKKVPVDSTLKRDSADAAKVYQSRKDSSKSKSISFSAGLGMHQLIPIDGQKLTPYNSQGRTGSAADYIPSVFVRMYKNEKWFLQLEFRYGAPQTTKQFTYSEQSNIDTIGGVHYTTTTSFDLKKTFYHQLPLTFNYFVTKDWSVGAGLVWNKFYSAVSEESVNRKNNTTQVDSLVSKKVVSAKDDSAAAFSKSVFNQSYFQAILETQYRWKRFSAGAKYSFGLQPYIKFSLPGGTQQEERNRSLQIFIRYELWKSKAKR